MNSFGLTEHELAVLQAALVEPLTKVDSSVFVWIFGSRASGRHKPFSDVDIMVESSQDLSRQIGKIQEYFENSSFPYKVDLVEKRNFASSYLAEFEKEKVRLN